MIFLPLANGGEGVLVVFVILIIAGVLAFVIHQN